MEDGGIGDSGGDDDVGKTRQFIFGGFFSAFNFDSGVGAVAIGVKKVDGLVGNGWVAGTEESRADVLANDGAFGVKCVEIKGNAGGEGIKDRTGWDREYVGGKSGDSFAEGNFLGNGVASSGREWVDGDGGGGVTRAKLDRERGGWGVKLGHEAAVEEEGVVNNGRGQ